MLGGAAEQAKVTRHSGAAPPHFRGRTRNPEVITSGFRVRASGRQLPAERRAPRNDDVCKEGQKNENSSEIGDITIDAVDRGAKAPWRPGRRISFPAYDEAVFKHHLPSMEPGGYFDVCTWADGSSPTRPLWCGRRITSSWSTPAPARNKGHPPAVRFSPARSAGRNEFLALGIGYDQVDYVFWHAPPYRPHRLEHHPAATAAGCRRSRMRNMCFTKRSMRFWEAEYAARRQSAGQGVFADKLPADRGRPARRWLVDDDYALDDTITLTPTPGQLAPATAASTFFSRGAQARGGGDRRHDAPHHPVPRARLVAAGRLGRQSRRRFLSRRKVFVVGWRRPTPLILPNPFSDADRRSGPRRMGNGF